MNKNLEDMGKMNSESNCFEKLLIKVLGDHEKRLTELEKFKFNILGYYEINETGGVNNIKVGGTDPD